MNRSKIYKLNLEFSNITNRPQNKNEIFKLRGVTPTDQQSYKLCWNHSSNPNPLQQLLSWEQNIGSFSNIVCFDWLCALEISVELIMVLLDTKPAILVSKMICWYSYLCSGSSFLFCL